mmetsp:Transcript_38216/g.71186  ORF Transcript_38216/g.71186 Transcript_38216/m.71186 type:complete len:83 (-) Transcript_38216:199-447(-)
MPEQVEICPRCMKGWLQHQVVLEVALKTTIMALKDRTILHGQQPVLASQTCQDRTCCHLPTKEPQHLVAPQIKAKVLRWAEQ